jgi:hypothetical protein
MAHTRVACFAAVTRDVQRGSGTITIHAADETNPQTKITCFGAKRVFRELRSAWNNAKLTTVVA